MMWECYRGKPNIHYGKQLCGYFDICQLCRLKWNSDCSTFGNKISVDFNKLPSGCWAVDKQATAFVVAGTEHGCFCIFALPLSLSRLVAMEIKPNG